MDMGVISPYGRRSIIIPGRFASEDKPFFELANGNRATAYRVMRLFERTLERSFDEDEDRHGKAFRQKVQTQAELKRRADIMARWFRTMRGELGFSVSQVEAELHRALRSDLDGVGYEPPRAGRLYGAAEGEA